MRFHLGDHTSTVDCGFNIRGQSTVVCGFTKETVYCVCGFIKGAVFCV